jgi:hypothetical protein
MAFGDYNVRPERGARITDRNSAVSFMRTLDQICLDQPHWKLAERSLALATDSPKAETMAGQAFKAALQAERWLETTLPSSDPIVWRVMMPR